MPSTTNAMSSHNQTAMLDICDLRITIPVPGGVICPVRGFDLCVNKAEIFGIVGESGCGKTIACMSLLGLTPSTARVTAERMTLDGKDLLHSDWAEIRGRRVAMIFQDPAASLNPVFTIGSQLQSILALHRRMARSARRARALELLKDVGLPDGEILLTQYPHQLSGGMQQRVMIACALATGANVLIADEPTTALDVAVQAQILRLLQDLRARYGLTIVLVTHDLAIVAEYCDRVAVIYAGRVVETAPVQSLFDHPSHPYTRALLASLPAAERTGRRLASIDGAVPSAGAHISGCAFAPRCSEVFGRCRVEAPQRAAAGQSHEVLCHKIGKHD